MSQLSVVRWLSVLVITSCLFIFCCINPSLAEGPPLHAIGGVQAEAKAIDGPVYVLDKDGNLHKLNPTDVANEYERPINPKSGISWISLLSTAILSILLGLGLMAFYQNWQRSKNNLEHP